MQKYSTFEDLPDYLSDDDGNAVDIHKYMHEAMEGYHAAVGEAMGANILASALVLVQEWTSKEYVDKWLQRACEERGINTKMQ